MLSITSNANTTSSPHSSVLSSLQAMLNTELKPPSNKYSLILDIEDIVPEPFIKEVPVPHGFKLALCTLRMEKPNFLLKKCKRQFVGPSTTALPIKLQPLQSRNLAHRCSTFSNSTTNVLATGTTRLQSTPGKKCGCKARFTITHHIATDSLQVEWHWKHSHELNTKEDMENTQIPKVIDDWIITRVDLGIGWKGIHCLLSSRDLHALCARTGVVVPASNAVLYNHVNYLIKTRLTFQARRDRDVFVLMSLWEAHLTSTGWHTYAPVLTDSNAFLFAI
ncbi:hypothetical protein PTTG_29737 [Puccinia triticina 1-1 BBBD Race 1]|uniref:Uncharacterized protein n=1 Tax=Puccinia triticina (isolate 1-1 / race 1 (BBBD)) TaxID=630390 RepID=A0A180G2X4_PUCT1|nr:hypothetical protein PTTG_29737 [Puccinia triticina 1-1 BBBD Race 1]